METQPGPGAIPLRILVVGGGGIGAITALNLAIGGNVEVSMVLRSNYAAVSENGYHIRSVDHGVLEDWRPHRVLAKVPSIPKSPAKPYHFVACTTKNILEQEPSMVDIVRSAITPNVTTIVLIQNGINIEKPFISAFPTNVVLSGVSYMGSHERSYGAIEQDFPDKLDVGVCKNYNLDHTFEKRAALEFVALYGAAGKTNVRFIDDVARSRWTKLLYNATINPLCAILQMNTSDLLVSGVVEGIARPAMAELCKIAAAKRITMNDGVAETVIDMTTMDIPFEPSMLVDVFKGNLIEFENIIGEPMREAYSLDIPTPFLSVLYHLCRALQWRMRRARD